MGLFWCMGIILGQAVSIKMKLAPKKIPDASPDIDEERLADQMIHFPCRLRTLGFADDLRRNASHGGARGNIF